MLDQTKALIQISNQLCLPIVYLQNMNQAGYIKYLHKLKNRHQLLLLPKLKHRAGHESVEFLLNLNAGHREI